MAIQEKEDVATNIHSQFGMSQEDMQPNNNKKDSQFKCDICGKKFSLNPSMKRHA